MLANARFAHRIHFASLAQEYASSLVVVASNAKRRKTNNNMQHATCTRPENHHLDAISTPSRLDLNLDRQDRGASQ